MKNPSLLIIRFSSLGDILLTSSFIQAVDDFQPGASIYFLTKSYFSPLLSYFPRPVNPILLENFTNLPQLAMHLRTIKFQQIYDLHGNLRSHALQMLMGLSFRHYHKHHWYRWYKTQVHQQTCDIHTTRSYLTALPTHQRPTIAPLARLIPPAQSTTPDSPGMIRLGIHPGASFPTKQWPLHYLEQLIGHVLQTGKFEITLIGGKNEEPYLNKIQSLFSPPLIIRGPILNLDQLIYTIATQNIMLTNDSGPAHLSAALNIPLICLFGATHPSLGFAPLNPTTRILFNPISCSPCTLHGSHTCPKKHFQCMLSLTPQLVLQQIHHLVLDSYPQFH